MSSGIDSLISKLKSRFIGNGFANAVITLVSGTALGQAISLLTVPVVSRLYDQVAYGEYAILISCATILCTVSQAGLASAIMAPENEEESKRVFSSSFWMATAITTLVIIILAVLAGVFSIFELTIPYWLGLIILFVYALLNSCVNLLRIFMNRLGLYRALFWNSLIGAMGTLCITIPLGFVQAGVIGFMIAEIAGKSVCVMQMISRANPFVMVTPRIVWRVIKDYRKYVLFQFPANFVHTCTQQMPNQVLEATFGSASLGSYSMTNKILAIPSRLIAHPINTAYFKTATEYYRSGDDLGAFTYKLVKRIMLAAIPIVVICICFGEPIFTFVLGEQWGEAGTISAILILWYVFDFCFSSTSYCRVAINRQGTNLIMSIVCFCITGIGFVIGVVVFDDMLSTVFCFGVFGALSKVVDTCFNFVCMKSHVKKYVAFVSAYVVVMLGLGFVARTAIGI